MAIADSVDALNPDLWDRAAAAGGILMGRRYLRMLEQNLPLGLTPCYALLTNGGEPLAAVSAQWLEFDGARVERLVKQPSQPSKRPKGPKAVAVELLKPIARSARSRLKQRVLVCGNILSWGCHGVSFASAADPTLGWSAVTEALYRMRRSAKLAGETDFILIKDITTAEALHFGEVRRMGYHEAETEPNMVLQIPSNWRCFDDYVGALSSKYRKSAKQIGHQIEAAGFVLERLTEVGPAAPRLHELYAAVHHAAPVRLATLPSSFWASFADCCGDDLRCSVVRKGRHIVGFVNTLRDGENAMGYQIGFDRDAALEAPIYLRLLQATIDDAISLGCKRLSLGRTALEPKSRLGAQPEPMKLWVRHRSPALNWLVKGIVGHIPHEDAPERNPFK